MLTSAWALGLTLALTAGPQSPQSAEPPAEPTAVAATTPAAPAARDEQKFTQPFQDLLRNLVRDMRALPSRRTAFIIGAGTGGALALHAADDNVARWALTSGHSGYSNIGDVLGDGWTQAAGAIGAYTYGYFNKQPRTTHIGTDLIRAQILNGLVTTSTKVIAQRERPGGGPHSFPSGHTSAAFVSASVLQAHLGWKTGAPAYALASYIGWTRLRDDRHWLTDVIVGAAIGTAVGQSVSRGHRPGGWTIAPVATTNSAAIYFTK